MRFSKYWHQEREKIERERARLENSSDPAERSARPGMTPWPGKVRRPNKRLYTTTSSPHDPVNNFVAQKYGGAVHIPQFDRVIYRNGCRRVLPARKRWADQPEETPPYIFKRAQALASVLTAPRLTEMTRLRDHRNHIHEQRLRSGAQFQDGHSTVAEHARGIQWSILQEIELHRRHDQLRWCIDAKVEDSKLNFSARVLENDVESNRNRLKIVGAGWDTSIADAAGFKFEEVDNTINARRSKYKHPLRERKKPGPKPKYGRTMPGAERQANSRARKKAANLREALPVEVRMMALGLSIVLELMQRQAA
jgi:hypothetical protein